MYIKTTGLVLRETPYKESSRVLTVLTSTEGKITVMARGAKRKGSKTAAACQLLSYSDMTLFSDRGRYVLTESRSIEMFEGLRDDLSLLCLGSYFAEILEVVSDEDMPNPEMLSLGLNALWALSRKLKPKELIKAAFEMRLMCLSGFEPAVFSCGVCGREDMEAPVLSLTGGVVTCRECAKLLENTVSLTDTVLSALRHITGAEAKKLYSFSIGKEALISLSKVCEAYLIAQLGRGFGTLDFYKSVAG